MKSSTSAVATCAALVASIPSLVLATEAGEPEAVSIFGAYGFWWLLGVVGSVLALRQAWQFYTWMEAQRPARRR